MGKSLISSANTKAKLLKKLKDYYSQHPKGVHKLEGIFQNAGQQLYLLSRWVECKAASKSKAGFEYKSFLL
jgi:hypothetical protein